MNTVSAGWCECQLMNETKNVESIESGVPNAEESGHKSQREPREGDNDVHWQRWAHWSAPIPQKTHGHTHTHTQAGTESSTEQKRLKKAEKHAYTHINMHGNVFQPTPSENQTHNNSYVLSGVKPQKQLRSLQTKTTHRHVSVCFIAPR